MSFLPGVQAPPDDGRSARWYVFRGGRIVLDAGLNPPLWTREQLGRLIGAADTQRHYLGLDDGVQCHALEWPDAVPLPEGLEPVGFREALVATGPGFFRIASQASQLLTWDATHRFCGRCGARMDLASGERARRCPACGLLSFPRVSPAVIVTVLRGEEILLGRAHRFAPGMYSVLAGFVEAGESLEECMAREIREIAACA
jgi:NAD+ diphosphatase